MKTIFLKVEINFENYEDVNDELILEDSGILDSLKKGVNVEILDDDVMKKLQIITMLKKPIKNQ